MYFILKDKIHSVNKLTFLHDIINKCSKKVLHALILLSTMTSIDLLTRAFKCLFLQTFQNHIYKYLLTSLQEISEIVRCYIINSVENELTFSGKLFF